MKAESIDYKQLLKATASDRLNLIKTNVAQDLLNQLTPVERAKLFPKYYLDKAYQTTSAPPPSPGLLDRVLTSLRPPMPPDDFYSSRSYKKAEPEPEPTDQSTNTNTEPTAVPKKDTTTTTRTAPPPKKFNGKGNPLSSRRQEIASGLSQEDRLKIMAIAMAEEGNKPLARKRIIETMFNRADAYKMPINSRNIQEKYYSPLMPNRDPGGYKRYQQALDRLRNDPAFLEEMTSELDEVISGSNYSNYATQNSSLGVADNARKGQTVAVDDGQSDLMSRKDKKGTKYYDKREDQWYKDIQQEEQAYLEQAQETAKSDPTAIIPETNQTGKILPDSFKPVESFNVEPSEKENVNKITPQYSAEQIEEFNTKRPQHLRGKIRIGEEEFEYGSGAKTKKNFPSVPYGTYVVGDEYFSDKMNRDAIGLDAPGMSGNSTGFDPKIGRNRTGIVFHANNSNDLDRLYSHGCITVRKKDWPRFKKALLEYKKANGGKVYLHVSPNGAPMEISNQPIPGIKQTTPTAVVEEKVKEIKETGKIEQGLPEKINGVPNSLESDNTSTSNVEPLPADPTAIPEEENNTGVINPSPNGPISIPEKELFGAEAKTTVEAPNLPSEPDSVPEQPQTPTAVPAPVEPSGKAVGRAAGESPTKITPKIDVKPTQSTPDVPMMKTGGEVQASGEDFSIVDNNSKRKLGEVSRGENIKFNTKGRVEVTPDQRIDPRALEAAQEVRQEHHERVVENKQETPQATMMQGARVPEKAHTQFSVNEQWGHTETPASYVRAMAQAKGRKHDGSFPGSRFGEEQLSAL